MPLQIYKPFDVLVVPFPFTEQGLNKKRPVIVISGEVHQEETGHLTILMITTAKKSTWPSDVQIFDLEEAGLPQVSYVRQKIVTVDERLVLKKIGHLSLRDKETVYAALQRHFLAL